jgi:phage/plasmid-associated DNA primase
MGEVTALASKHAGCTNYETSQMYNAYTGYCRRIGQNHPVKDTVFGKSIAKYLPSMSKRREGGNNRRHVYLLPSLDQARKDFISVTNIPNTEWAIDCEDLFQ